MPDAKSPESGGRASRSLLRRHLSVIIATGVLASGGAYAYARLAPPTYTASASVLVVPYTLPNAANPAPDIGTEQAIATSTVVLGNAAHALKLPLSDVRSAASVSASATADVLAFGYSASTPQQATRGATATAAAYMALRNAQAQPSPRRVDITKVLAAPAVKTRLISPALQPTQPSSPDPVLDVLAGLIVGLLAGLALAFLVDRFGRRVRTTTQWQETTGVTVLAALPGGDLVEARATSDRPGVRGAVERTAHALRYVRVRLTQTLRPGAVLLVTAARELPEQNILARSLADGFGDLGWTTKLVLLSPEDTEGLEALLRRIERTRASHDLVIVTAPPVTRSVIALDVAGRADAALVLDDLGSARRSDAVELVAELLAAGVPIAGGVLLGVSTARTGTGSNAPSANATTASRAADTSRTAAVPARSLVPRPAPLVGWVDDLDGAPAQDHVNGRTP